jgi:hypothetical protein
MLSDPELEERGIKSKEERKQLLAALHKAGYQSAGVKRAFKKGNEVTTVHSSASVASSSVSIYAERLIS